VGAGDITNTSRRNPCTRGVTCIHMSRVLFLVDVDDLVRADTVHEVQDGRGSTHDVL
jgi:hypothetical protein